MVTSGTLDVQVRGVRDPDRSDSQADSAGSIPVTRSDVMSQDIGMSPNPRTGFGVVVYRGWLRVGFLGLPVGW